MAAPTIASVCLKIQWVDLAASVDCAVVSVGVVVAILIRLAIIQYNSVDIASDLIVFECDT